jgi:hypothetical protein
MDREQQIEITSFEHFIIDVDGVKHIRYVLKTIIDGESIQCNLQEVYQGYPITKEGFIERAREGMIKERYR